MGGQGAVLQAVRLVACFNYMAVPIQQRRGHFGVAKHTRPFREAEVGGDDLAGVLVQVGRQVNNRAPPL